MGLTEVELSPVIKAAMEKGPASIEKLLRDMALIIDKQALCIKNIRWSEETVKRAMGLDEWLFEEIKRLQQEAKGVAHGE